LLRVDALKFSYGDAQVLDGVSLEVGKGEIVALVGANGAGKTTLLRNVSRLLKPLSGTLQFEGRDLAQLEAHEVVRLGIVHVPEGRRIFPELTVLENLRIGAFTRRAEREKNLELAFTTFPRLKERAEQLGGTLSGGEQQMLAISRGLMASPRLLILDEPSLGLAPLIVKQIFAEISSIHAQGISILLVEQNVYQSLHIAQRAYVMERGRIVLQGSGSELLSDPTVKKAFLGA
jgi:branched-chain amino acid transport system ATP-binding protein